MGESDPPSALTGMAYLKSKSSSMNHTKEEKCSCLYRPHPQYCREQKGTAEDAGSVDSDPWPLLTLFLSSYQASFGWVTPGFLSQPVCRHEILEETWTKEDRKRGVEAGHGAEKRWERRTQKEALGRALGDWVRYSEEPGPE